MKNSGNLQSSWKVKLGISVSVMLFSVFTASTATPPNAGNAPAFTPPPLPVELRENTRFAPGYHADDIVPAIVFRDESVEQVFRYLEELTGKTVLQQESLPSPLLNFHSPEGMTRSELLQALETILSLNGVSVTSLGERFIKAVPTSSIRFQSPDIITGSTLALPPSQRHYTKIFDIKHLSMTDVPKIVNAVTSPGQSNQLIIDRANSVLVTDSLTNLQQLEKILNRVDVPNRIDSQMTFRSLNYVSAEELMVRLEAMTVGPLKRFLTGETHFEADDRTNQIIIMTNPENAVILDDVINNLDVDAAPLTQTEVFYLKHANSEEVASLLDSLISGQNSATRSTSSENRQGLARSSNNNGNDKGSTSGASASKTGDSQGSKDQFSPFITIEPDERANAIIAFGTSSDLRYITDLISKVDIVLKQVKIDVIIAEVNIGDEYARGIDSFGLNIDSSGEIAIGLNKLVGTDNSFGSDITDLPIRIGATLEDFTLNTVFQTAQTDSDVTILSAPTLVTTHNKEARISAGEKRPIITGSSTDQTGSSIKSEVEQQEIGIELTVTPLIGSNGVVQLEIEQTIESVNGSTIIDGNEQPIIGSRSAVSYVSVNDGDTIVLGGLQEIEERLTEGKMFLLGQIPILGDWLFSSKRIENTHQDLVIFIRPQVIYTTDDANTMARELIRRNNQKDRIDSFLETQKFEQRGASTVEE